MPIWYAKLDGSRCPAARCNVLRVPASSSFEVGSLLGHGVAHTLEGAQARDACSDHSVARLWCIPSLLTIRVLYDTMVCGITENQSIREGGMETVTVSPKYQVVIPGRIRKLLGVKPGQKVKVILYDNRIEMIPVRPVEEARGFLSGIDTSVEREPDRQ